MKAALLIALLLFSACSGNRNRIKNKTNTSTEASLLGDSIAYDTIGNIERLAEELLRFVPANAKIEILAEGFTWSEGPVWVEQGSYLIFSDVPENKVYKWKEGEGLSVYLEPSGYTDTGIYSSEQGSNGLAIDHSGQLLLCQHGDRRVARMMNATSNPTSEFITLADKYEEARFNSPNDLAVHKDGSIYFTDPPYGLPGRDKDTVARELDYCGVFRVDPKGNVTLLTDDLTRPNGIALSPDYKICYVNISDRNNAYIMAYDINEVDGSFENKRIFFDARPLASERKGSLDGLKVHPSGYVFTTGPGGVLILSPEGKHLGTILTTQGTANCAFDSDYSYLYMTADYYLMRIRLVKEEGN